MFEHYKVKCKNKEINIGKLYGYQIVGGPLIIFFPTKNHWSENSKLETIAIGLMELTNIIPNGHIESIAIPALGCGEGGLEWEPVKTLMLHTLKDIPIECEIYAPLDNK